MAISWKTYYFKLVTKRVNTNMNEEILVIPIPITCYLKADLMGVFYLLVISILFLQFSENYSNRLEMRFFFHGLPWHFLGNITRHDRELVTRRVHDPVC